MKSLVLSLLTLGLATPAFAGTYVVDGAHSQIGFSVTHMMVSTVHGAFGKATGTLTYDPKNVAATKVTATIDIASVDTHNADRDAHLRSPDFFDAATFPEMTFVSTGVKAASAKGFDLVGNLTIRGVTKAVTLHVAPISAEYKDPWGNTKVGTSATTTINRQDFGVSWNKALDQGGVIVGDTVTITLDLELSRQA